MTGQKPRFIRAAERIIDWCDRYEKWHQDSQWGDYNFPDCVYCGANRKMLNHGPRRLMSTRFQGTITQVAVTCKRCGGKMTATQSWTSKGWNYFDAL